VLLQEDRTSMAIAIARVELQREAAGRDERVAVLVDMRWIPPRGGMRHPSGVTVAHRAAAVAGNLTSPL
jgi:hypothetical protein